MPSIPFSEVISKAARALSSAGLVPRRELIPDGQWHRTGTTYKESGADGSYKLFADEWSRLLVVNFHEGGECQKIQLFDQEDFAALDSQTRRDLRAKWREEQRQAERELAARREAAAVKARLIFAGLARANADNPYLKRKGCAPLGDMRQCAGKLVLPLMDEAGAVVNLQFIAGDGQKRFLAGGRKQGCFFPIPAPDGARDGDLLIGEGAATVLSGCHAASRAGLVGFDAGNLLPVAKLARARYPKRKIGILGDWDKPEKSFPNKGGKGAFKAREAAEAIRGHLVQAPPLNGKADWNDIDAEFGRDEARRLILAAMNEKPLSRPTITYRPGEADNAAAMLRGAIARDVYQFGGELCRIIRIKRKTAYKSYSRHAGSTVIEVLNVDSLGALARRRAKWLKAGQKGTRPCDPPVEALRHLLADKEEWDFPILSGIVNCPVMRDDGSVFAAGGYDDETSLYGDYRPGDFEQPPECPCRADAEAASLLLLDALREFEFKGEVDQAVALAAMLTTVCRPSVPTAPLFAISAPCPGTGKTALADMIAIIATGRRAAALDYKADEAEFKKALFSLLLGGSPVTLVDNVVGLFNSSQLNSALTSETLQDRILGASSMAEVPTMSIWLATGNNLTVVDDMIRRCLFCTLDSGQEKPSQRRFSRNIYAWTVKERPKLVLAAMTILLAYHRAGRPGADRLPPMGSFEEWSSLVRGALKWIGAADPLESQAEMNDLDPERQALSELLQAWHELYGSEPMTAAQLLDESPDAPAYSEGRLIGHELSPEKKAFLNALALNISTKKGLNGRVLGSFLRRFAGRPVGGFKLARAGHDHSAVLWKVVEK